MEDSNIFDVEGVFFLSTPLRVSRQGIGGSVCLALAVMYSEVVARKFLSLADLSGAQILLVHELTKVVVVCKEEDLVFANF